MKHLATAIIAILALLSTGCEKNSPRLDGVSFSDVYVQGLNAELTLNFVVRELSHANARLGISNAPKISVVTYQEMIGNGNAVEVTLTAWTSNGLHATASATALTTELEAYTMADVIAAAARNLVAQLSEKVREAPTPEPKERLIRI